MGTGCMSFVRHRTRHISNCMCHNLTSPQIQIVKPRSRYLSISCVQFIKFQLFSFFGKSKCQNHYIKEYVKIEVRKFDSDLTRDNFFLFSSQLLLFGLAQSHEEKLWFWLFSGVIKTMNKKNWNKIVINDVMMVDEIRNHRLTSNMALLLYVLNEWMNPISYEIDTRRKSAPSPKMDNGNWVEMSCVHR